MVVLKLVKSGFQHHRVRMTLTILAIALSVSLVVAVTSGYTSAQAAFFKYFAEYVGATDLEISKSSEYDHGLISPRVYDALAADDSIRTISGRLEQRAMLRDAKGEPFKVKEFSLPLLIGVDIGTDVDISNLHMEPGTGGGWFTPDQSDVIVIDQEAAKAYELKPGDELTVVTPTEKKTLKVVGIVHKPAIIALFDRTAYLPLKTLQEITHSGRNLTSIRITLKVGTDVDQFVARWKPELAKLDPKLDVSTTREARKRVDKQMQGIEFLSYLGGCVSMVAAMFIVFSTLSMGVSERQRNLAMLRAVGMLRGQVVRMVLIEGIVLAVVGAVVGVPLGLLWTWILTTWKAHVFIAGMVPSLGGVLFASAGSVAASLVAGILPALAASRVSPVEAMSAVAEPSKSTMPVWAAVTGLVLIAVDPLVIFGPGLPRAFTFYGHFFLGLPAMMVGFFLLAPAFVWGVEKVFGPVVAPLMGVRYGLLRQQLSRSIWRAAGTAASLMVGLAILVVMQTQGNSVMQGWQIPDRFPDIFIFAQPPAKLSLEQVDKLDEVPGIRKGQVMPIGVTVTQLPAGFMSIAAAAVLPDATMFIAVEPKKAFEMMDLKFLEGDAETAAKLLDSGRYVVVTDEFRQLQNIHVGSTITLKKGLLVPTEYKYKVAGVIWSPGIDVFVSVFDTGRQFRERSAASVFGSLKNGAQDFGINSYNLFAANLDYGVEKTDLEKQLKKRLGDMGLRMGDVRQIKYGIQQGFKHLLWLLSSVAFAAIIVASLGVTNTIMASVRSRRWHLGILRSVGLTRGELLRLIIAESLLLGLVAAALGVTVGLLMSLDANGLSMRIMGYKPPIAVPWDIVMLGVGIVVGVALLASAFPAFNAARQQPLTLLQTGRAAG